MKVDEFLTRWHALVRQWVGLRDSVGVSHALLRDALESGLSAAPALEEEASTWTVDPADALDCEIEVLRLSGLIDLPGYTKNNVPNAKRMDPVEHFATRGWHDLCNPSLDFDLWWYWYSHIGLDDERVNPLLHYALAGRHEGQSTLAPEPVVMAAPPLPNGGVRRACLFAAFDVDGVVDDYVIDYLRRLREHCDVYYLADAFLRPGELAKLSDVTTKAWAIPHGRYDFGSYALLAQDLVGWERLEEYDEIILANDSCYALSDFDHVFDRMDRLPCDWWGLQASKADFSVSRGMDSAIPMSRAKAELSGKPEWRQILHLHISSYFLALRRQVCQDPRFRDLIRQIAEQPSKTSIILKYEIGLSKLLIDTGHPFETYIDKLYPFHPVYNADTFELIAQGFPLLKRTFLVENSTKTPDLVRWKDRVLALVPEAPVDLIERNLERVAPHDQLTMSFAIVTNDEGEVEIPRLMPSRRMRREDGVTPTFEHWWAFPVSRTSHELSSDARAIFEEVRDDPSLKKVILTRSRRATLTGNNTVVVPLDSPEGQYFLLRAGRLLLSERQTDAVTFPISDPRHLLVDVVGGPYLARPPVKPTTAPTASEAQPLTVRASLAGSDLGAILAHEAFPVVPEHQSLRTGAPRWDFITGSDDRLPSDLAEQVVQLRDDLRGRRLVLFAPAVAGSVPHGSAVLTSAEVERLGTWLDRTGSVLGLRENPSDRSRAYAHALAPLDPLDLSVRRYPHIEAMFRLVDVLVSDCGPGLVDFLMTGRPVVVHAPHYDEDRAAGRLLIDCSRVIPGPVCRTPDELIRSLEDAYADPEPAQLARYEWCRDLFFEHRDSHNAWRAVQALRRLSAPISSTP